MTELNKNSETALYVQIADILARQIDSKLWLPSEKLPSEQVLMDQFKVSRVTARQAMRTLAERGLVTAKQGKGVYVTGPTVNQELNELRGFYDSLLAQGHEPETQLLNFDFVPVHAADGTSEDADNCYCFKRLYKINNLVIAIADATIPESGRPITRAQAELMPVYSLITNIQRHKVIRASTEIRSGKPPAAIAKLMGLKKNNYLLEMLRTSYDSTGHRLETTRFYIQPDYFAFHLDVAGPLQIAPSIRPVHDADPRS
ncbi:MAG: GntR family transcriptional regulator [Burkholderiaceae bacterium]|nr:GntR family transcriptional regulator [Burkholderiaceae bacterium]